MSSILIEVCVSFSCVFETKILYFQLYESKYMIYAHELTILLCIVKKINTVVVAQK